MLCSISFPGSQKLGTSWASVLGHTVGTYSGYVHRVRVRSGYGMGTYSVVLVERAHRICFQKMWYFTTMEITQHFLTKKVCGYTGPVGRTYIPYPDPKEPPTVSLRNAQSDSTAFVSLRI